MRIKTESRLARRSGKILILTVLLLPVVIGSMAVVVDLGLIVAIQAKLRTEADAAALAGARLLNASGTDTGGTAKAAALARAASNVYTDGGQSSTVTVNIPPLSGTHVGQAGYVEAVVQFSQPKVFGAIWGSGSLPISVRAVANGLPKAYSPSSLIVLDPSSAGSLTVSGSGHVIAATAVQVNSSNSAAVNANNAGYIKAPSININGNYSANSGGYLNGTVMAHSPVVADPMTSLTAPTTAGLTTRGSMPSYGSYTMNPGVYNGGVSIGGGMNVTMNPGLYYMKSGSFSVANGATLTGNGVTIYVDSGGGTFSFQGGGVLNLSAQTSGPYTGVVMFLDKNSTQNISIANGSTSNITGTVYAPNATISFAGGAAASQYGSQLICKKMNISNNADVRVNWSSGTVARAGSLSLVE